MPALQALADLGSLNKDELLALIEQIKTQQANASASQKAFQIWVASLHTKQAKNKTLTAEEKTILLEAAKNTTDKSESELSDILSRKLNNFDQQVSPPKSTRHAAQATKIIRTPINYKKWTAIGLFAVCTIVLGNMGYDYYQKQQVINQQIEFQTLQDKKAWKNATDANQKQSYLTYLKSWPKGQYVQQANEAISNLAQLTKQAQFEKEQITKAQRLLVSVGYSISVDGNVGKNTENAIREFQKQQNMLESGRVDDALIIKLQQVATAITAQNQITAQDESAWAQAKRLNTPIAYQDYLDKQIDGKYRAQATDIKARLIEQDRIAKVNAERTLIDRTAWQTAMNTNTIEAYQGYLNGHPEGSYRTRAQQGIKNIELENSQIPLTINVSPKNANVSIFQTTKRYETGIRLLPGQYKLEISLPGYKTQIQDIELTENSYSFDFTLKELLPPAIQSLIDGIKVIPSGSFMMGSDTLSSKTKPVHKVNIKSFKMTETEITFAMWDTCVAVGACTAQLRDGGYGRGNRPVTFIIYPEIYQQFIPWLNKVTGEKFRLPSEAEWEYAARAGSQTKYNWGDNINCNQARYGIMFDKHCKTRTKGPVPVKSYAPNAFGLFDMHGNVSEMTEDCYRNSYSDAPTDGSVWEASWLCSKGTRSYRGGSWNTPAKHLESAYRMYTRSERARDYTHGFRLVME
ncbi:MAG: peptidoglycan hydrolase-like protein with peptidoglycan-binding domain [Alphaproteobacteria bacterium]|jgi:peptidoglycan hydrolase-like protein with peptidoglycan-binding domain